MKSLYRIQETDTEYKAQLRLQKEFMFVINTKGHPLKYPQTSFLYSGEKFLFDSDYSILLRKALSQSFFARKKEFHQLKNLTLITDLMPIFSRAMAGIHVYFIYHRQILKINPTVHPERRVTGWVLLSIRYLFQAVPEEQFSV